MNKVGNDYLNEFTESVGYMDFARVGPPSKSVVAATTSAVVLSAQAGPRTVDELMEAEARAVGAASRLSGFAEDHVTLIPNTSTGLFQIAFALTGGDLLVHSQEFPANLYPWMRAEQAGLLKVQTLVSPGDRTTPSAIADSLTPTTSAVTVSAVDFTTGYRADLAGIRSVIGDRLLIVDAIQGFGILDEAWEQHVDVLVVGGQKWLRAGWGMGFLALSDRALNRLEPVLSGWTGAKDPTTYDGLIHPRESGAREFSLTNLSPVNQAAFAAALELVETVTPRWIDQHIRTTVDILITGLEQAGALVYSPRRHNERGGIVTFSMPGMSIKSLSRALAAAGVSITTHADHIRASIHATTTQASIDLLLEALR